MHIGMSGWFLENPSVGVHRYQTQLMQSLAQIDTTNTYTIFLQKALNASLMPILHPHPTILPTSNTFQTMVEAPPPWVSKNKSIAKTWWEQSTCRSMAYKANVDILHIPYFASPVYSNIPTIVTIHDIIPVLLPEYHEKLRTVIYNQLVTFASKTSSIIITVSEYSKQDIIKYLHIPEEKVRVTAEAAGDEFKPVYDKSELASIRKKYNVPERFVFYLGGLDPRKNLKQLIRAFAQVYEQLKDPELKLFISAKPEKFGTNYAPDPRPLAEELGMSDHILYQFVEDADKPAMYSAASVFVFPSAYEGFGLDPLEAMSCGAPVVCSNRTSLPEVTADATLSVDPDNVKAMAEAITSVLTNPALAADLQARALRRATAFTWQKSAEETLSIYEELYEKSHTAKRRS